MAAKKAKLTGVPGRVVVGDYFGVLVDTEDIVATLSAEANTKLGLWARDSFKSSKRSSNFRQKIKNANEELADDTRNRIIKAYKAGKKRGISPYRQGDLRKLTNLS